MYVWFLCGTVYITSVLNAIFLHPPSSSLSLSHRSTNLNELAKAVRLLAALDVEGMTPDDLLRAARALANATAGLLNASSPEHLEVREHYSITCSTILV